MHTKTEGTKYVARLRWLPAGATSKRYDFIPGTFVSPAAAADAQAQAQEWLGNSGPEAVWPDGLPGSNGPRLKRDEAYWEAERAACEQKAADKAAAKAAMKAAREAAEAARPKKPRREKAQRTTVPLPADRDEITVECTRDFLVDPPAAGTGNAAPRPEQVQYTPVPVPPGLDIMEGSV